MTFENQNEFPLSIQVGKDYFKVIDADSSRNPVNIIRIDLGKMDSYGEGLGLGAVGSDLESRVSTRSSAQQSLSRIDEALGKVNDYRSYLGATQNRIKSAMSNLDVHVENLQSSRSAISDTDFAAETANMTQMNILQNAGASVLSQANAQPNIVMSLLK